MKCDNGITVYEKKDGVYTAALPNATRTYTFTASYAGDSNYNAVENVTCTVDVTRKKSSSSSSDTSAPTYGVSTGKTENGEISVTPAKAEAGETVTIKATPRQRLSAGQDDGKGQKQQHREAEKGGRERIHIYHARRQGFRGCDIRAEGCGR